MLVESIKGKADASEGFMMDTIQYEIDSPALVFDVLCNRMYTRPFWTMIQEYLANARDANREAEILFNKPQRPVQITMPNTLDPHLCIRDFGIGLSAQRIKDVFTRLGASTKSMDDTMTGGFGLGAKIGWAYGDSFSVISIVDGVKTTYLAYLNEAGCGALSTLNVEDTFEESGVIIKLFIKPSDVYDVQNVIEKITYFWELSPECESTTFKHYNKPINRLVLYDDVPFSSGYRNIFAIVDGIPYLVDANNVPILGKLQLQSDKSLCIFFDTGEVDIAINREGLRYSSKTVDAITHSIQSVVDASSEELKAAEWLPVFSEKVEALSECYTRLGAPGNTYIELQPYLYLHFSYHVSKGALLITQSDTGNVRTASVVVTRNNNVRDFIRHKFERIATNMSNSIDGQGLFIKKDNLSRTVNVRLTPERYDNYGNRFVLLTATDISEALTANKYRLRTMILDENTTSRTIIATQNKHVYDFLIEHAGFHSINDLPETIPERTYNSNGTSRACGFTDDDVKSVRGRITTKKMSVLNPLTDTWCTFKEKAASLDLINRCKQYMPGVFKDLECYYVTWPQVDAMKASDIPHIDDRVKELTKQIPANLMYIIENEMDALKRNPIKQLAGFSGRYFFDNHSIYNVLAVYVDRLPEDHVFRKMVEVGALVNSFYNGVISKAMEGIRSYNSLANLNSTKKLRMENHYCALSKQLSSLATELNSEFLQEFPLVEFLHSSDLSRRLSRENGKRAIDQIFKYLNGGC